MTTDEFNRYCAEVMGYTTRAELSYIVVGHAKYHPATDLNQMAEVFDKLWHGALVEELWLMPDTENNLVEDIAQKGIAQAMREYIESTKEES